MTEVVIPLNKTKLVLMIVGSVAFVLLGLWIWSVADAEANLFEKGLAVATILFFGTGALYGCVKLFDDRPGLIIDAEGIVDNSSAVAAGRIPWADIIGVRAASISGQRFLTIDLLDPQKYVARGGRVKRSLNAVNAKLTGSPINISSGSLRVSFDELERTLTDALRTQIRKA